MAIEAEEALEFNFYFQQIIQNYQQRQPFSNELIKTNLQSILWLCNRKYWQGMKGEVKENEHENNHIAARFRYLVSQNFMEIRTINQYADLLHISPNHLSQTIKQTLGVNAKSIIDARLLIESEYLLRHTPLSITEISYKLGFPETAHFTRFFKKHRQASPSSFRQ
ncbi:MAG: AraC family transcriptional regulator [Bacteroidota bacterium]